MSRLSVGDEVFSSPLGVLFRHLTALLCAAAAWVFAGSSESSNDLLAAWSRNGVTLAVMVGLLALAWGAEGTIVNRCRASLILLMVTVGTLGEPLLVVAALVMSGLTLADVVAWKWARRREAPPDVEAAHSREEQWWTQRSESGWR